MFALKFFLKVKLFVLKGKQRKLTLISWSQSETKPFAISVFLVTAESVPLTEDNKL